MDKYFYRKIYNYMDSRLARVMAINVMRLIKLPYYRIVIDTNNMCNLRCIMCSNPSYKNKPQIMPMNLFVSLAREIFPKTRILDLSCGYEPFMTKNIIDYFRVARNYCKGKISIVTNGLLIKEDCLKTIFKEGLLDEIIVSIDGFSSDTYNSIRKDGNFADLLKVLEWIKNKKNQSAHRLLLRLNFTAMRCNIEELSQIYEFAVQYNVDAVQIRYMRLTREVSHLYNESLYYYKEMSDRIISKVIYDFKSNNTIELITPPLFSSGKRSIVKKNSCALPWFSFHIKSNGDVDMCARRIGNLSEGGLRMIEKSSKVSQIRKNLIKGDILYCSDCNLFSDVNDVNKIATLFN
jgi:MoaA/NifB/PqqE/SkfB family radical SAM enzyme